MRLEDFGYIPEWPRAIIQILKDTSETLVSEQVHSDAGSDWPLLVSYLDHLSSETGVYEHFVGINGYKLTSGAITSDDIAVIQAETVTRLSVGLSQQADIDVLFVDAVGNLDLIERAFQVTSVSALDDILNYTLTEHLDLLGLAAALAKRTSHIDENHHQFVRR